MEEKHRVLFRWSSFLRSSNLSKRTVKPSIIPSDARCLRLCPGEGKPNSTCRRIVLLLPVIATSGSLIQQPYRMAENNPCQCINQTKSPCGTVHPRWATTGEAIERFFWCDDDQDVLGGVDRKIEDGVHAKPVTSMVFRQRER